MKSERFWRLLAISVVLLVAAGVAAAVGLTGNFLISDETASMDASSSHVDKHPKMSTEVAAKIQASGIAPPAELMTVNIYLNTNKTEDLEELQNHTAEILRIKESRIIAKIYTREIVDIADLPFVSYMDTPLQVQLFSNVAISETGGGSKDSRMSTEVADSIPPPGIVPPAKPMIVNLYLTENKTEKIKELENYTIDILYEKENMIVAEIYTKEILNIVNLPVVSYMDTPLQTQLFSDVVVSEGLKCFNADMQHNLGNTGKGVKVAIVDHGFEGYEDLLGTELPESVTVKSFRPDGDITGGGIGIIHGTGCAEVVHDVAPDAELYLVNSMYDYQLEEIVDYLISEEVDIVSHSAGATAGLFDGTDYN